MSSRNRIYKTSVQTKGIYLMNCFKSFSSKALLGLLVTQALATSAAAVPYASNKCAQQSSQIKHPDGAQGVLFDEECRTAYVLPPERGDASMSAMAVTSNINYCSSVNKIPKVSERLVNSIDEVARKIEVMIKDFEPQEQRLVDMRAARDKAQAENNLIKGQFETAEKQLEEYKQGIVAANSALDDCLTLNSSAPEKCEEQQKAKSLAESQWRSYKLGEYRSFKSAYDQSKYNLEIAENDIARQTSQLAENLEPLYDLQLKIFDLRTQLSDLYKEYAPLRALTGQVVFSVEWANILNQYAELNQSSGLDFIRVPVISAKVHATAYVDGNRNQVGIPVLMHAAIPGLGDMGVSVPSANPEVAPDVDVPPQVASTALGIGDAAISGQMTLSAVGACPYYPQGVDTVREDISSDELTAYLTVNAEYEFPLKARRKYKATYHLTRMMERIEKKTKRGGFFSSKTVHSVTEKSNSDDWFKIDFDANDPDFSYTPAEQDAITAEVKMGLIERSLGHVAATTFGAGGTPPALPNMPETGASVTGRGINGVCGFWIYCRAASFVLLGLDSIFGSSTAVSEFKRTNNVWATDDVNQVAIMRRRTSLTFTAK